MPDLIVLSTVQSDQSTSAVIDWLGNHEVLRINNDDVPASIQAHWLPLDYQKVFPDIKSIWFRKGHYSTVTLNAAHPEMEAFATEELYALSRAFYSDNQKTRALGTTEYVPFSKLSLLLIFKQFNLNIPETLVTSKKEELIEFRKRNNDVIIKPLSEGVRFKVGDQYYKTFTERLTKDLFEALEPTFFPTLFQKRIEKKFEIRSFYLNEEIFSMAILNPSIPITDVDSRIHSRNNKVRRVPYKLPTEIENRMKSVMKLLCLDTGSFDIIHGIDNAFYFLELNLAGQFENLS